MKAIAAAAMAAGALTGILLAACDAGVEEPATAPYPGREEPRAVEPGPVPLVEYPTPAETLFVRARPPDDGARLVFFRGRGVSHDAAGAAYVIDPEASRVLVVGPALRVFRTVGGPSEANGALGLPLSVAPTPAGGAFVVDVEHPDGLLYFGEAGDPVGSASPPVLHPNLAGDRSGVLWASRSPYIFGFEPTEPGEPLLYRFDPLSGEGVGIAEIDPIQPAAWNRLANAGAVAAGRDGTGFFAFLLRNELRAYRSDGELVWRTRRLPGFPTSAPGAEEVDGEVRMRLRPVTQALSVGPDGRLYALTASADPPGAGEPPQPAEGTPAGVVTGDAGGKGWRRLEVYDPETGALLRASRIPALWTTLAVGPEGHVYRVDPERIIRSAPPPTRPPLPDVTLERFDGERIRFDAYRGKALLINFWASWCEPCKRELPALEEYYARLDRDRAEFLAISEDAHEAAARRFAGSLGLSYPLFLGRGKLREHFRYLGLPYTLIADYRGRVVAEFMGFGNPATWRRLTRTLEAEMERAAPAAPRAGPGNE